MRRCVILLMAMLLIPVAAIAQDGKDEFFAAARKGDVAAVKAFLDKGMDVNAKTQYGATALSYACDKGHVELVRLLIERGADINVRDTFYSETPLGWALYKNRLDIVKLLLDKGATGIDRVLMTGVYSGNKEMVRGALDKGGLKAESLTNALSNAKRDGKTEIAEMLTAAGATLPPPPNFKVDAQTLQSYAGTYRSNFADITFVVKDGALVGTMQDRQTFVLGAKDKTTFGVVDLPAITITFLVEGDKVSALTWKQEDQTFKFERVEK
jgi:ankyrin repeat protein